jgi:hypothetical protein
MEPTINQHEGRPAYPPDFSITGSAVPPLSYNPWQRRGCASLQPWPNPRSDWPAHSSSALSDNAVLGGSKGHRGMNEDALTPWLVQPSRIWIALAGGFVPGLIAVLKRRALIRWYLYGFVCTLVAWPLLVLPTMHARRSSPSRKASHSRAQPRHGSGMRRGFYFCRLSISPERRATSCFCSSGSVILKFSIGAAMALFSVVAATDPMNSPRSRSR